MNLHALRLFNQVAHRGSFSRAASALHISQPAVSKAVAELEAALGQKLFDRGSKPVLLTVAGKALFRHSETIFNAERDASIEFQAMRSPKLRTIRMAASGYLAQYALAGPLLALRARHPGIRVQISEGNLHQAASELGAGTVDLAAIEGLLPGFEHLSLRPWISQELALYAPAGHHLADRMQPLTANDLADEPMVLRESGSATLGYILAALTTIDAEDPRHIFASSTSSMIGLAAAGGGLVLAPIPAAQHMVSEGSLVMLDLGKRFHRTCAIAKVEAGEVDPTVLELEDFLCAATNRS